MGEALSNQGDSFQIRELGGKFQIEGIARSFNTEELAKSFLVKYKAAKDIDVDVPHDRNSSFKMKLRQVDGGYYSDTNSYYLKDGSTYYWARFGDSIESCLKEHEEIPFISRYLDVPNHPTEISPLSEDTPPDP